MQEVFGVKKIILQEVKAKQSAESSLKEQDFRLKLAKDPFGGYYVK